MTNIVINIVFKLILNQARMRKDKSLYDSHLIKFDSISEEISCTSKMDGPRFMDHPMDLVHGPGPPLIFKRKSPLLIWKFTGAQGMKNTDSYLFINIP